MKLCFSYLLSKIEGCVPPTLTGAATLSSKGRQSKILAKKDHFRPLLKLTSLENAKSEEPKEANHLADKTFSFVNIGSVICFPMPFGTKFEFEIAKISVAADDNLLVL